MYNIRYTNKFKKDVRRCQRRGRDLNLLRNTVDLLARTGTLPLQYRSHSLSGKYKNRMECHIQSDWLLVWMQNDNELVMLFTDTGTHSDLF
ncbi:MAG: type II toxin-antitoxin system YafQ family toxin [Dysgonamonadaceae bacterium]|jgi:mRNA interferase YafQ|nr:type II toxin-antitoxin system YafQ family toxin [Dysgonamonadaceae bacterium]